MKSKVLLAIIGFFAALAMVGTTYSAWTFANSAEVTNNVHIEVPAWAFDDTGFAKIENVSSSTNLECSKEETVTQGSPEALRLTSTTGTATKDHIVNIDFDRDYYVSEVQFCKFEFDYYHRYKREQYDKGFPTVQFLFNNSLLGTSQGGTDLCTEKSAFIATPIDEDWWHLEFFVFAHLPTIARHSDTPIALTKKINRVRINDRTVYDYAGVTAFTVIDNMRFSSEPASRLGIFNRWTNDTAGKYFWFKVAFSGQPHSVKLYSSNTSVAVPEFDPTDTTATSYPFPDGSPFYFRLLQAGTVRFTAVLEVGDNHELLTITSDTFTVKAA